jgi:type II secretory pathway component GspD/PulD (secretin)
MKPNRSNRDLPIFCALLLLALLCLGIVGCATPSEPRPDTSHPQTFSSFDVTGNRSVPRGFPPGSLNFQNADLTMVLAVYQEISQRTVIRPSTLPAPTISVRNQTPLSRVEALQLLDTVLAENGIAMVLMGPTGIKAVPLAQAAQSSPPEITLPWRSLPDSGSYMMRTVQLKKLRPSEVVPVLMPFSKAPGAVLAIDSRHQLILRDFSANVRKMLQVLEDLESQPSR